MPHINPGGGDFQSLDVKGEPLFAHVARRVATEWSEIGECGLVVGATFPDELGTVRWHRRRPAGARSGVGAQGGDIEATVAAGATADGFGMVINSSRAILYASNGDDFAEAACRDAQATRDAIRSYANAMSQQVSTSTEMMPRRGAELRRARTVGTSPEVAISMTAVPPSARGADVHVGDVDAGIAEQRADDADDAGPVVVLDHQHVVGRRHVDAVVVDHHDALLAATPDQRARQRAGRRRAT